MSLKSKPDYIYGECDHVSRVPPNFEVDEEIAKAIGTNYRTLPTFENSLYKHVLTRHYSLERNDFLKCRWQEYKRQIEGRLFAPFQFPDNRDLHFQNHAIRFLPSESLHNRSIVKNRRKSKPGPGVDSVGQTPIPQELMMKRGIAQKEKCKKGGKEKTRIRKRARSSEV